LVALFPVNFPSIFFRALLLLTNRFSGGRQGASPLTGGNPCPCSFRCLSLKFFLSVTFFCQTPDLSLTFPPPAPPNPRFHPLPEKVTQVLFFRIFPFPLSTTEKFCPLNKPPLGADPAGTPSPPPPGSPFPLHPEKCPGIL